MRYTIRLAEGFTISLTAKPTRIESVRGTQFLNAVSVVLVGSGFALPDVNHQDTVTITGLVACMVRHLMRARLRYFQDDFKNDVTKL